MDKILRVVLTGFLVILFIPIYAQNDRQQESLPHYMTEEEKERADEIGRDFFETEPPEGEVRPIAEFEPMESVLIRYPFGIPMELIATMSEEILVTTIVENESEENYVMTQYENNGVNTDSVTFIYAPTDSYWTRDYGPLYIEHGDDNQVGIVNFPYNRPRPNDDDIPIVLADSLDVELFGMDLVHTGGNYMADGVNSAASTTLVIEENPEYTVDEINGLMNDYLGVETYHLNEDPLGEYIEHIDCWAKFLSTNKILIGEVPEDDPRYEDFEAVANYYENATSAWGTNYEVYRIFTPGGSPATPYTNSLILNDRVFVPLTGSQWDDEAIETYEEVMPGYEIIGIEDDMYDWENTDALHCRAHEMADRNMLKIKHNPLLGEVEDVEEQVIEAEIIPFSGEALYADSLKVYYKLEDEENYSSTLMENTGGDTYEAAIPVPNPATEVSYYIHAADESGRSENHPYIGAPDPHEFQETGSVAEIETNVEQLSGACQQDETAEDQVVIYNNGSENLSYNTEVNYNDVDGWLSVTSGSGIIAPGDSAVMDVTMDATGMAPGNYTADLLINSNDPFNEQVVIPVTFDVTINTNITKTADDQIRLIPNPFNENLKMVIDVSGEKAFTIDIISIRGQEIMQWKEADTQGRKYINWNGTNQSGQEVPDGIYLIKVQSGKEVWVRKVQKL